MLVPVLVRGTVVGSIHLTREPGRPAFTADDLLSVDAVANAVGFVIDGARSQDREELRRRWLEASAWLGEALRPPIDGQLALKRITEVARVDLSTPIQPPSTKRRTYSLWVPRKSPRSSPKLASPMTGPAPMPLPARTAPSIAST